MKRILLLMVFPCLCCLMACQDNAKPAEEAQVQEVDSNESSTTEVEATPNIKLGNVLLNKKVNGYDVDISWEPNLKKGDNVIGPAVLEFKKDNTTFKITNDHFGLPGKLIVADYDADNYTIDQLKTKKVNLDYQDYQLEDNKLGESKMPFFFLDLDFDGKKELLLAKIGQGQRYRTTLEAYAVNVDGFNQISNNPPYKSLDAQTEVNYENKELSLFLSGGACGSEFYVYAPVSGSLQLTKVRKQEMDVEASKCYESTYEVLNGEEKFVSKRELTR